MDSFSFCVATSRPALSTKMDVSRGPWPPPGQTESHVRFEDFAECFPLYVQEDKNSASGTFTSISDYIESQTIVSMDGEPMVAIALSSY